MGKDERIYSWEQQPGESSQAFSAFLAYLEMGEERSLAKVGKKLGKSSALMERWSSKWGWVKRVEDYRKYTLRKEHEKVVKDRSKMIDRHIGLSLKMQKKAMDALDSMPPDQLSARDVKEFLKLATEIERVSRNAELEEKPEFEEREDALSRSLRELAERGIQSD